MELKDHGDFDGCEGEEVGYVASEGELLRRRIVSGLDREGAGSGSEYGPSAETPY